MRDRLNIVFEDNDLLVVNKPPGLLTSTVPHEPRPTLLAAVKAYLAQHEPRARVGLIHRLDRDASGLLVFSKNRPAYLSLKQQLKARTMERIYHAIVAGVIKPPQGRIHTLLVEHADGSVHVTKRSDKGQDAITEYLAVRQEADRALLRIRLHTGRKHQIRAHLAARDMPILNDRMYGEGPVNGPLLLAATELALDHPRTGRRLRWTVPLPRTFGRALRAQ